LRTVQGALPLFVPLVTRSVDCLALSLSGSLGLVNLAGLAPAVAALDLADGHLLETLFGQQI